MKKLLVEFICPSLEDPLPSWRVVKVVGDISFHPSQILRKDCMTDLCRMTGTWEITITAPKVS